MDSDESLFEVSSGASLTDESNTSKQVLALLIAHDFQGFKIRGAQQRSSYSFGCVIEFDGEPPPGEKWAITGEEPWLEEHASVRLQTIITAVSILIVACCGAYFLFAASGTTEEFAYQQPFATIVLPDGTLSVVASATPYVQAGDQITHLGYSPIRLVPDEVATFRRVKLPHSLLSLTRHGKSRWLTVSNNVVPAADDSVTPKIQAILAPQHRQQMALNRTHRDDQTSERKRMNKLARKSVERQRQQIDERKEAKPPKDGDS